MIVVLVVLLAAYVLAKPAAAGQPTQAKGWRDVTTSAPRAPRYATNAPIGNVGPPPAVGVSENGEVCSWSTEAERQRCKAWSDQNAYKGSAPFRVVQGALSTLLPGGPLINAGLNALEKVAFTGEGSQRLGFVNDGTGSSDASLPATVDPSHEAAVTAKYSTKRAGARNQVGWGTR